jgi:hypothetical protein
MSQAVAAEFGTLLEAGGFRLRSIAPAALNFLVIEAVPG